MIELELGNKEDLQAIGRAKMAEGGGDKKSEAAKSGLSQNDKPVKAEPKPELPKHNTQKEIARAANVSTGQVGMAEQLGGLSQNDKTPIAMPKHDAFKLMSVLSEGLSPCDKPMHCYQAASGKINPCRQCFG